jgi:predicted nucleic acid-binding protein
MEVLPKAIYYQRPAEQALYERFFAMAHLIPVDEALIAEAYTEACTYGLSTIDALHITAAKHGKVGEFIATEKRTGPLFCVINL